MELHLPTVTLFIADGVDAQRAARAVAQSCKGIWYRACLFMAPQKLAIWIPVTTRIGWVEFTGTLHDYNLIMTHRLNNYIENGHVLVIQHDGYVLNPQAWTDEFLQYDFIGAPWPDGKVGNGGFSLRSKRFLEVSASLPQLPSANEDAYLLRGDNAQVFETAGCRIAPMELAARFSIEGSEGCQAKWDGQFGFHGVMSRTDISAAEI